MMSRRVADESPVVNEQSKREKSSQKNIWSVLLELRTFVVLVILIGVFAYLSPVYLSPYNLLVMTKHVAINAILAIGMTFVILSGGIDLSVGSIVGLTGMIAGGLIAKGLPIPWSNSVVFFKPWVVILIGLALGMGVGAFNGFLITCLCVPPFIATLGTQYMARGFALLTSGGRTFPNLDGSPELGNMGFEILGGGSWLGVPIPIWLMIVLAIVAVLVTAKTPFGRHIYAVGGNRRAARLSGIQVQKVEYQLYVISGLCAALAGLIVASELQSGHPSTGTSFELNAIAAVVLGGTSLAGGRGTIWGTIIGSFIIGFLSDGLVLVGVSSFWQTIIKGAVIVAAVVVDIAQEEWQRRRALKMS